MIAHDSRVLGHGELKQAVEAFLFEEADLLDDWKLEAWEALLTEDARYLVPPICVDDAFALTPDKMMFVVADDREMLAARVGRLLGRAAFAELPRSRLRRTISNIRLIAVDDAAVTVTANVVVYRVRRSEVTMFIGKYRHRLRRSGDGFRIAEKCVALDIDILRGQGGISIIL